MDEIEKLKAEIARLKLIIKRNVTPKVFVVTVTEIQAVGLVDGTFGIIGERQLVSQRFMASSWEKAMDEAKSRFREELSVEKKKLNVETKEEGGRVTCKVFYKNGFPIGTYEVREYTECDMCRHYEKRLGIGPALLADPEPEPLDDGGDQTVACIVELLQIIFEGEARIDDHGAFDFYMETEIEDETLKKVLPELVSKNPMKEFAHYPEKVRQTVHGRLLEILQNRK